MSDELQGGNPASPVEGSTAPSPAPSAGADPTPGTAVASPSPTGEAEGSTTSGAGDQPVGIAASTPAPGDDLPPVDSDLEAKPGFQAVRSSYNKMKERAYAAEQELSNLKSTADSTPDSFLQVNAPVDDWDADAQLERLRTEVPPYYNKMAWAVIERHLPDILPVFLDNTQKLPPDLAPLVEASAAAILKAYTGLEPEHIGAAIRQYQASMGLTPNVASPTIGQNQSPAPVDVNQLGLDPTNPAHLAVARKLAQLESSVQGLTQAEETRLGQTSQQRIITQVDSFKSNLLSKVEVPPSYDYVKGEIADRAERAFERDPAVVQAKTNLERYYKQGTPDLRAAAAEVNRLQERYSFHFKAIAEPRLNEVKELERLKAQIGQTQAGVKNIPSGTGMGAPIGQPARIGSPITPESIGDLAWERVKSSKLNPNPLT